MTLSRPTTLATHGMVASPHYLATNAGLSILESGGSAMDAAIAANAILTVIYPDQTAIGGDCFFLAFDASTGSTHAYNGSGPAPGMSDAATLRARGWRSMPAKGPFAVTVPGTIDAWFAGHDRFGSLDMTEILTTAITLARDGFPVSPRLASAIGASQELIGSWPGLKSLLYSGGSAPSSGSLLRIPNLSRSLETIASGGRDAFYTGPIATAIADAVQSEGGWLSIDDLEGHAGEWVEPVSTTYRGMTVKTTPPNSQGLTALIGLRLAEHEAVGSLWGSVEHAHPLVEAANRAYHVRNTRISDPRFVDIDTSALLEGGFIDDLWADYDPGWTRSSASGNPGDTVYLCAVDADGNAVSMIQSLYGAFGSCVVAGDTGIILQNRGTWFSLDEGHPNVIEGGKRTMHTLMSSMLFDGPEFRGVFGTQGGDAQAQIQMQLVSSLVDFGLEPQAAIDAPRWMSGRDGELLIENGFPEGTVHKLSARGHRVTIIRSWNAGAGHAQMILTDRDSGVLMGAADPRADGSAAGY